MSKKQRQIWMYIALAYCIVLFFIPIRFDFVTAAYETDAAGKTTILPDNTIFTSTIYHFQGHPAGRISLGLFSLMPFWFLLESEKFMRPLHIWSHVFLRLQAMILFLGAPYLYYVLTYENTGYENIEHHNALAWGGYYIIGQTFLMGILLIYIMAMPDSRITKFIFPLRPEPKESNQPKRREGW